MTAMRAARLLLGLSLATVGERVSAKRAWISELESVPSRAPSPALRKRLCTFYGVDNYATLARAIDAPKLALALLANLNSTNKEIRNVQR